MSASFDPMEVARIAKEARLEWGLAADPVRNATRVAEEQGVAVVFSPPYSRGIDAYSRWVGGRPIIVQAATEPTRLRFDLFHELGHLVMHRDAPALADKTAQVQRISFQERQANRFAAEMLVPHTPETVEELASAFSTRYWGRLFEIKGKWGISLQALLHRAEEFGLITSADRRSRMEDIGKRGWRVREPGRLPFPEVPCLVAGAIRELEGIYPDAAERLRRSYGIPVDLLAQITARSPGLNISPS